MRLIDVTDVIRSKNAGPYEITFDIIFKDEEIFEKVAKAHIFNKKMFAELFNIKESDVLGVIDFKPAKAIKITIRRPICAGDLGERDVYGAQQHVPLLSFEFDL